MIASTAWTASECPKSLRRFALGGPSACVAPRCVKMYREEGGKRMVDQNALRRDNLTKIERKAEEISTEEKVAGCGRGWV